MERNSVLIIGAGKIGAFFDTPGSEHVLTHAHAFSRHPGFKLLGFVDAVFEQANRAAQIWSCDSYPTISAAFKNGCIDVAVVAAPDDTHCSLLKELKQYPIRLVFAEKPLTKSLNESVRIVQSYQESGISLAMNYTRRYVPEFSDLRVKMASRTFGRFLTGTGYYGKGTLHNGSHMIDLIRFLLGDIELTRTLSRTFDYYDDDPSCSAEINLAQGGQFIMQAVDCRYHTIFELDLLFELQRVRIVDSGFKMEIYSIQDNEVFSGYRNLSLKKEQPTRQGKALSFAVENIHEHFARATPLLCSGVDGLLAQQISSAIIAGAP